MVGNSSLVGSAVRLADPLYHGSGSTTDPVVSRILHSKDPVIHWLRVWDPLTCTVCPYVRWSYIWSVLLISSTPLIAFFDEYDQVFYRWTPWDLFCVSSIVISNFKFGSFFMWQWSSRSVRCNSYTTAGLTHLCGRLPVFCGGHTRAIVVTDSVLRRFSGLSMGLLLE